MIKSENVEDFHAKGEGDGSGIVTLHADGIHDDADALQRLLQMTGTIPDGMYAISHGLKFKQTKRGQTMKIGFVHLIALANFPMDEAFLNVMWLPADPYVPSMGALIEITNSFTWDARAVPHWGWPKMGDMETPVSGGQTNSIKLGV